MEEDSADLHVTGGVTELENGASVTIKDHLDDHAHVSFLIKLFVKILRLIISSYNRKKETAIFENVQTLPHAVCGHQGQSDDSVINLQRLQQSDV